MSSPSDTTSNNTSTTPPPYHELTASTTVCRRFLSATTQRRPHYVPIDNQLRTLHLSTEINLHRSLLAYHRTILGQLEQDLDYCQTLQDRENAWRLRDINTLLPGHHVRTHSTDPRRNNLLGRVLVITADTNAVVIRRKDDNLHYTFQAAELTRITEDEYEGLVDVLANNN